MSKTGLIDGDMVCFVIAVNKKQDDTQKETYGIQEDRTLEDCQKELDRYLESILINSKSDHFIGFLTTRSFRYDIYPEYKANRKDKEKPKYLQELRNYVIDKYKFVKIDGYEADDLLASYQRFLGKYTDTVIISTDKDMLQIEGDHFNPRTNVYRTINSAEADLNLFRQVLLCDPVDNIKKSFRFGPKSVDNLFDGVAHHNYLSYAVNTYVQKLGLQKGLNEFNLNFNLIYLIRDESLVDKDLYVSYNVKDFFPESFEFKTQYDLLEEIDKNSDRGREQSKDTFEG